jgi:hypothetical protein
MIIRLFFEIIDNNKLVLRKAKIIKRYSDTKRKIKTYSSFRWFSSLDGQLVSVHCTLEILDILNIKFSSIIYYLKLLQINCIFKVFT